MLDEKKTKIGTELLVEALDKAGVELVFGYPGGAALHIYDQFYRSEVNHVLVRHEQGAGHMADAYARATGEVGVVLVTSGPGATNLVTPIATALSDSVPMVIIAGQVAEEGIGKDAFQETDVMGIMTPVTKYAYQVRRAADIPRIIREAFYIANTGRKGPVVVDIPKNIGIEEVSVDEINDEMYLPAYQKDFPVDLDKVKEVRDLLKESKKPLILAGAGVAKAGADEELRLLANTYKIPVTTTLLGLGTIDHDDDLNLGMAGMHGSYASNMALMECDLLINIGSRFDDRVASDPNNFAPDAKIVHVDIDAAEHGKVIKPDVAIVADAKDAIQAFIDMPLEGYQSSPEWVEHQAANKAKHPTRVPETKDVIRPQRVIEYLGEITNGDAFIITDVGQHQMWAAQYYPFHSGNQLITSGGLGTMGFGVPATIGTAFTQTDRPVVGIIGDGGFQMTAQELNIIQHYPDYGIKPKFILLNNEVLGMVHQWQQSFYDERYSHSEFGAGVPDFVKLSEALGVKAARVTDPADLEAAMDEMMAYDGAYVLEVKIDKYETVVPMVASGRPNNEMEGLD